MATNPNPARITPEMWRLWEESKLIIPGVRLGGIYANKPAYHNTVDANKQNYPGNYSIKLALDLRGPRDKARAIDLTMSDAEMKKRTGYLKRSALHPDDNRLDAVREFYGTLDGKTVYGLTHNGPGKPWERSSSDPSHLWHDHLSIFTEFVDDWEMLEPILSVLSGETWEAYVIRTSGGSGIMLPAKGDKGYIVEYWQRLLEADGMQFKVPHNGVYDADMIAVVKAWRVKNNVEAGNGERLTAWMAMALQRNVFRGQPGPQGLQGDKGDKGDPGTLTGATVTISGTVTSVTGGGVVIRS
jgi:hypothetical protein